MTHKKKLIAMFLLNVSGLETGCGSLLATSVWGLKVVVYVSGSRISRVRLGRERMGCRL